MIPIEVTQFGCMLSTCTAIYLAGKVGNLQRWSYIIGVAGTPFWWWYAYILGDIFMAVTSTWCAYSWGQGVLNYWIKKEQIC